MGIQHYKREAGDDAAAQAKRDGLARCHPIARSGQPRPMMAAMIWMGDHRNRDDAVGGDRRAHVEARPAHITTI